MGRDKKWKLVWSEEFDGPEIDLTKLMEASNLSQKEQRSILISELNY